MQYADPETEDIRDRMARAVRMVMDHTGQSASQVARKAGVAPSTITRLLDPDGKFVPTNATVQKLGRLLHQHTVDQGRNVAEAHRDVHRAESLVRMTRLEGVPLVGQIRAGAWIERAKASEQKPSTVPFVDRSWPEGSIVAYEMADGVTDPAIPKGGFVFVNLNTKPGEVRVGDRVLIQRRAEFHGSTKVELALWEVAQNQAGDRFFQSRADGAEFIDFEVEGAPILKDVDIIGACVGVYIK